MKFQCLLSELVNVVEALFSLIIEYIKLINDKTTVSHKSRIETIFHCQTIFQNKKNEELRKK